MADELTLLYESPANVPEVREAIRRYWACIRYEQELCADPGMIERMGLQGSDRILHAIVDFETPAEIISYIDETVKIFRQYRREQQPSSNPTRTFFRDRKTG